MRVGPTLARGKQGWDRLIAVAGFPSHRPGKQEEKAAKPPAETEEKEREWIRYTNGFPQSSYTTRWELCKVSHEPIKDIISRANRRSVGFQR